uniref:Stromal membrane-associated n=1 Tax=Tetraselmis sp. GSL018 TaxID=582737 RepID=A0A061QQW2_9CHLO
MSTKAQDIKHEKILRALSKQPENKRCINCETLGPGYVVTDLRIFVCTTCAGVHRNFGHRVKSISMATFSPNEVKAMQEGGNLVAEATYLARWTSRDQPKPTDRHESNISRWIRAVYEDKAFFSSMSEVSHEEQASHARHEHSHGSVSSHNSPGIAASAAPATSAAEPSLIDHRRGRGWVVGVRGAGSRRCDRGCGRLGVL